MYKNKTKYYIYFVFYITPLLYISYKLLLKYYTYVLYTSIIILIQFKKLETTY